MAEADQREDESVSSSSDDEFDPRERGFRFETVMALNDVFERHDAVDADGVPVVDEDWELSQFWYDEATTLRVLTLLTKLVPADTESVVACVSTPTIYRGYQHHKDMFPHTRFLLFEYDTRFQVFEKDFCFYDYNKPEMVKEELHHTCDVIVADPPFLAEECVAKVSQTIALLSKESTTLMYLTGKLSEPYLRKYHPQLTLTPLEINHEKHLENSFGCFCSRPIDDLI